MVRLPNPKVPKGKKSFQYGSRVRTLSVRRTLTATTAGETRSEARTDGRLPAFGDLLPGVGYLERLAIDSGLRRTG